jgi:hypothetical protein
MREISKTSAIGWSMQILLHPFKHCGIFRIFLTVYIKTSPKNRIHSIARRTNERIVNRHDNITNNCKNLFFIEAGVPGPLLTSLLRAMQRFLLICVFLFFVVVVILAFGEEYGISATNQMFAKN